MRVIRKNVSKTPQPVYVVTRSGRRVEEVNYKVERAAADRAEKLINMVQKYSPHEKDNIHIVHTSFPERIR